MNDMDGPLDFEEEDELLKAPDFNRKRMKVIELDDLLNDYYKEKSELEEKEAKRAKARTKKKRNNHSDDDDDRKEALVSRLVAKCHNQMKSLVEEEQETCLWGVQVFGNQKAFPPLAFPELESCKLLQAFMNNELNSVVELATKKVDVFLEGLLVNGWLLRLVYMSGHVEKSIATWAFNSMLYSSKENVQTSTCNFWCAILSSREEVDQLSVKIDWFPEYTDLRRALDIYGFLFNYSSRAEPMKIDSGCGGPPQNIRAWVKFVTACCLTRSKKSIFSSGEAEEIVEVIICLFLDRQLQGLLVLLNDFMQAVINYFTDQEWISSCENVAKFIACRISKDSNCIQAVECIPELNSRCKQFRSAVAYQSLLLCLDGVNSGEDILRSLIAFNVKDKNCDLFKMYICLVLVENWLLSSAMVGDKPVIYEMFGHYLRNCSCLISGTDLRSFASKVRNRAAYLLQFSFNK